MEIQTNSAHPFSESFRSERVNKDPLNNEECTSVADLPASNTLTDLELMQMDRFLSTKYLGHLFGDSFIRDTVHEGWFTIDGMIHIMRILKEHPTSEKSHLVLKSLEECFYWQGRIMSLLCSDESDESLEFDVYKLQGEISEKILKLEIGESVLIPGGCKGHIALYEVLKTHDDQVQFTVFNLGHGSHKHWILVENEGRNSIQGAYVLEHIPIKIFETPDFLVQLINLKKKLSDDLGYELYEEILDHIGGVRAPQPMDPTDYMRIQRAGTCSWKTLLAYLRTKLPLNEYKRLKLLARLDVFEKWNAMGRFLDLADITCRIISKHYVNEREGLFSASEIEFNREELLVMGLIKVKKTFQRYHFLLSGKEKQNIKSWYGELTGRDLEKDWDVKIKTSNSKNVEHFEKFA